MIMLVLSFLNTHRNTDLLAESEVSELLTLSVTIFLK